MQDRQPTTTDEQSPDFFSYKLRDVWIGLILPKLSHKDAWYVAGTCKTARTYALKYLSKQYDFKEDHLKFDVKYHAEELARYKQIKRKQYFNLFCGCSNIDGPMFMLDAMRTIFGICFVLFTMIDVMVKLEPPTHPPNHLDRPNLTPMVIMLGIFTSLLALLRMGIKLSNDQDVEYRYREAGQMIKYHSKKKELAEARHATLFANKPAASIAAAIEARCVIL